MPRYDFNAQRLFLDSPLSAGARVALSRDQANYLLNVLRLPTGAALYVFNGRDGEWKARLDAQGKRDAALTVEEQARPQDAPCDLHYLFAPLKHARLDYMTQKAVEMGASRLTPVITRRTQAQRVNTERMRANVVEAAEQCGVLTVAEVDEPQKLEAVLARWPADRLLVFCDEDATPGDPVAALRRAAGETARPLAVLIGPEGGFDPAERRLLNGAPNVVALSLGPRILRADTAAVAALAVVQTALGDWR
ncbi:MAG TPA: 16S rRNA (uracil(1498)-N(3))-methyltransferase [Beijerinckiaceae bacterium]|jgi:16S rRNA (uracil1498-N3)-methyltransferase